MKRFDLLLLEIAIAFVFIWFGVDKFIHPDSWTFYLSSLPTWMRILMIFDDKTVIILSAIVEVVLGIWLLIPWKNYIPAFLIAVYFIPVIVSVWFDTVAVRDVGLMLASIALGLLLLPKKA